MATEEFLGTRVALFLGMLSASGVEQADEAIKYLEMLDTANCKVQDEIGVVSTSIDDDFQRIHDYLKPSFNFEFTQNNFVVAWDRFYLNLMQGRNLSVGNCYSSAAIFSLFALDRGWEVGERHSLEDLHAGIFSFPRSFQAGLAVPAYLHYWHITEGIGSWGPTINKVVDRAILGSVFSLIPACAIFDEFMSLTEREALEIVSRLECALTLNPFFTRGHTCLRLRSQELKMSEKERTIKEKIVRLNQAMSWDFPQQLSILDQIGIIPYPDQ
ncbi:MAG: hypothetical protein WCV91_06050 [Candidatus Margulisiibacteriota bacterium]